jgi:hypothetical protein
MMTFEEARAIIEFESSEGVATTSRHGVYPDRARVEEILEALRTIQRELKGQTVIDRKLAASLFVISDQVQGNMDGALARGIPISEEFSTLSFFEMDELILAIFEDWDAAK